LSDDDGAFIEDFPWMTGSSWSARGAQHRQHWFDPNFSGQENPVDVIEVELTELSRRNIDPNRVEVTCTLQGTKPGPPRFVG